MTKYLKRYEKEQKNYWKKGRLVNEAAFGGTFWYRILYRGKLFGLTAMSDILQEPKY